jgi:outer membrane immunogenic protein
MRTATEAAVMAAGCCALALSPGTTSAADLSRPYGPVRGGYRAIDQSPHLVAPAAIWQGHYLGGHLGYGFGDAEPTGVGALDVGGIMGGLHAGYNWHLGNIVAGLEIDGSLANIDGGRTYAGPFELYGDHSWLSSGRVRLGYAFDNILLYTTGGGGFGRLTAQLNQPGLSESSSETQVGYAVGGGVEMKLAPNWSGRIEALHYGFGDRDYAFTTGPRRIDTDVTTVRAGLTFHFN